MSPEKGIASSMILIYLFLVLHPLQLLHLHNTVLGKGQTCIEDLIEPCQCADSLIFFLAFQVQLKEVVIHDIDIARALVNYIGNNCIDTIILGASTRNPLTRSTPLFLRTRARTSHTYVVLVDSKLY
jgi:hypothetical protein